MIKESISKVRKSLPKTVILCQLAEEASELSQAALKLVRAIDGINPTPISKQEALERLLEEISDVKVCINCIGLLHSDFEQIDKTSNQKIVRWARRLEEIY